MDDVTAGDIIFVPYGTRDWHWEADDRNLSARIREESGLFKPILLVKNCWRKELSPATSVQQAANDLSTEIDEITRSCVGDL